MSDMFDKTIPMILDLEGGYVSHPEDPGGETNYGISKRSYPELDIAGLTEREAKRIYRSDYWMKPNIYLLPDSVSGAVLDAAINMGPRPAVRLLQQTLGVTPDGIIGPRTAMSAKLYKGDLLADYLTERAEFYMALPTFKVFGLGWIKRLIHIASGYHYDLLSKPR